MICRRTSHEITQNPKKRKTYRLSSNTRKILYRNRQASKNRTPVINCQGFRCVTDDNWSDCEKGENLMYCLNCGWCCEHLSPLTRDENVPCPHLIEKDGMKLCGIYSGRPQQCKDHDFPATFCPVGMDVLKIDRQEAANRIQKNDFKLYGVI